MFELRERILETSFEVGEDRVLASGEVANNKLDMDLVWEDQELRRDVIAHLGEVAVKLNPKVIVPIPAGADKWGKALGKELHLPVRYLRTAKKEPGVREYKFKKPIWPPKPRDILIFDDVANYRTSLNGVLGMQCIRHKEVTVAGFLSIWDRGPEDLPVIIHDLEQQALIQEHIPARIDESSPLWKYAV